MKAPTGKLKFAYQTIMNMEAELLESQDQLKWAYCKKIGADSITGLDSCDDFKDWLLTLTSLKTHS